MNRNWQRVLAFVVTLGLAACQSIAGDPLFRLTLKVVDDDGAPVGGAKARVGAERRPKGEESGGKGVFAEGLTSETGYFSGEVEAWNASQAGYRVLKEGYYEVWLPFNAKPPIRGKWQPWDPTVEVVLKRKKNPVPMYAKRLAKGLPVLGESLSYDLEVGDWLAPHGKGKMADMFFLGTLKKLDHDTGDYQIVVSFSNPGDGIQRFHPEPESEVFRSPYQAPADGYLPEFTLKQSRRSGVKDVTSFDPKGGYFFRVRTILDKDGKVVKAVYGKIYGDFFDMVYYLNPDGTRNMEYDPQKNLLKPPNNRDRHYYEVGP